MADPNLAFCRELCKLIAPQVRAAAKERGLKCNDASIRRAGSADSRQWEFHFGDFYSHFRADNAFEARYEGWSAWMRSQGLEIDLSEEEEGAL